MRRASVRLLAQLTAIARGIQCSGASLSSSAQRDARRIGRLRALLYYHGLSFAGLIANAGRAELILQGLCTLQPPEDAPMIATGWRQPAPGRARSSVIFPEQWRFVLIWWRRDSHAPASLVRQCIP
jgi:hypothetical protein